MKVGIISFIAALLLALPAIAGPGDPCADNTGLPDFDTDGVRDECDNCDEVSNAAQIDGDQDGYGDVCDCEFSTSASPNGACDGPDFINFVSNAFGTTVPPTNCEFEVARPTNGAIDGPDFIAFVGMFGGFPGPACGNGVAGAACATPGAVCP